MKEYNCNAVLTRLTDIESGRCQAPLGSWFSSLFFLGSSRHKSWPQSPRHQHSGAHGNTFSVFLSTKCHLLKFLRPHIYLTSGFLQPPQSPLPKHALMWKPQETWFSCSGEGILQSAWGQVWENGPRIALSKRLVAASGSVYRVLLVRAGLGAFHLPFPALCPGLLSLLS